MKILIAIACSLAAAFLNALSSVWQRQAAGAPNPKELFSSRFIVALSKNKLWMSGLTLAIFAAVAEGFALNEASIVLVKPLLTTDLVFLMLILYFFYRVSAGWREWSAVAGICIGLAVLLISADPRSTTLQFSGIKWLGLGIIVAAYLLMSAVLMRHLRSPKLRAAIGGIACGVNYALTAGLMKLVLRQMHSGGLSLIVGRWELYAMIVSAIVSVVISQNTFASGPLTISQPLIETVGPTVSGLIGIVMLGDRLNKSPHSLVFETIGALLAMYGIIAMGSSSKIERSKL